MAEQKFILSEEGDAVPNDDTEDLSDIGSLSDADRNHLFGVTGIGDLGEEDDLSDLVDVSDEDIMGEEPETEPEPQPRFRIAPRGRVIVRQIPPGSSLGGIR